MTTNNGIAPPRPRRDLTDYERWLEVTLDAWIEIAQGWQNAAVEQHKIAHGMVGLHYGAHEKWPAHYRDALHPHLVMPEGT